MWVLRHVGVLPHAFWWLWQSDNRKVYWWYFFHVTDQKVSWIVTESSKLPPDWFKSLRQWKQTHPLESFLMKHFLNQPVISAYENPEGVVVFWDSQQWLFLSLNRVLIRAQRHKSFVIFPKNTPEDVLPGFKEGFIQEKIWQPHGQDFPPNDIFWIKKIPWLSPRDFGPSDIRAAIPDWQRLKEKILDQMVQDLEQKKSQFERAQKWLEQWLSRAVMGQLEEDWVSQSPFRVPNPSTDWRQLKEFFYRKLKQLQRKMERCQQLYHDWAQQPPEFWLQRAQQLSRSPLKEVRAETKKSKVKIKRFFVQGYWVYQGLNQWSNHQMVKRTPSWWLWAHPHGQPGPHFVIQLSKGENLSDEKIHEILKALTSRLGSLVMDWVTCRVGDLKFVRQKTGTVTPQKPRYWRVSSPGTGS